MNKKGNKSVKTKRTVPFLNYGVQDFTDYNYIAGMHETKKIVFDNLIEAIKFSVSRKKQEADLFKLNDDVCVSLNKEKWPATLKKAMEFYSSEQIEDYEKCKQCQELIEKCYYEKRV